MVGSRPARASGLRPGGSRAAIASTRGPRRSLDARPIADKRPSTAWEDVPDLTLVPEALPTVIDVERFRGARVLEVGPKYGVHSLWIDRELQPSELVFSRLRRRRASCTTSGSRKLRSPHRFVYGDLRAADELLELEPFDLVFFLGVLYHSAHHLDLLVDAEPRDAAGRLDAARVHRRRPERRDRPPELARLDGQGEGACRRSRPCGRSSRGRAGGRCGGSRTIARRRSRRCCLCEKTDELRRGDGPRARGHPPIAAEAP